MALDSPPRTHTHTHKQYLLGLLLCISEVIFMNVQVCMLCATLLFIPSQHHSHHFPITPSLHHYITTSSPHPLTPYIPLPTHPLHPSPPHPLPLPSTLTPPLTPHPGAGSVGVDMLWSVPARVQGRRLTRGGAGCRFGRVVPSPPHDPFLIVLFLIVLIVLIRMYWNEVE